MGVKTLLAAEVTGIIHGAAAAVASRTGFRAQFSAKRYSDTPDLPVVHRDVTVDATTIGRLFVAVAPTVGSVNQVRRVAAGGGLRVVVESGDVAGRGIKRSGGPQQVVRLAAVDVDRPLGEVVAGFGEPGSRLFLKCGRSLIELR
jgi:hypothetical protein